jgi:hypothetical protein
MTAVIGATFEWCHKPEKLENGMTTSIEYGILVVIKSPAVAVDLPDGMGIE